MSNTQTPTESDRDRALRASIARHELQSSDEYRAQLRELLKVSS